VSLIGRQRTWFWALGSMLVVVLVVGSAYVAHHAVVNARSATPVVSLAHPPLQVISVTAPGPSYELLAQDAAAGHVVALASPSQPICPPFGHCPPAPPLDRFVVFDAATGALLHQTPLTGNAATAAASLMLFTDEQTHTAYAVTPTNVTRFSTITGAYLGGYALPAAITWQSESGGAYDAQSQTLILVGDGQLVALDATTGHLHAQQTLPVATGTLVDGPVLNSAQNVLYLLAPATPVSQPALLAYDETTLDLLAQSSAPDVVKLGPLTADGRALALYEQNGVVLYQPALRHVMSAAAHTIPALAGAKALGWNTANGHLYVATAAGLDVRDTHGRTLATLPMRIAWSGSVPLLVDARDGLLFLPGAHGQVIVARDTSGLRNTPPLNADTAVVLAHAAIANFLPFTNQDPPFVTPENFLMSGTVQGQTLPMTYWIHYSDFLWTKGPYPGTTEALVTPDSAHPGSYLVTFTITWNETFLRTHSWVSAVAPDGSITLRSDTGDIVP